MKITDELLYQHAAEARDIWLDTLPNEDELPDHQFSDEFMASLETLKKQETGQRRKRRTPLQRVAAVFLAVLIGSGTWLGVDAEARAAFVSWFREFTGKSAVYTYVGEFLNRRSLTISVPGCRMVWKPLKRMHRKLPAM